MFPYKNVVNVQLLEVGQIDIPPPPSLLPHPFLSTVECLQNIIFISRVDSKRGFLLKHYQ